MSSPRAAAKKGAGRPLKKARAPTRPALEARADTTLGARALQVAAEVEAALAAGNTDVLPPAAIQALMAAACRLYSVEIEAGRTLTAIPERSAVTDTYVMVTASGLLKAANLAVFELGMWQSWTGR